MNLEDAKWLIARIEQLEAVIKRADELYADDAQRTNILTGALTTGP